jgi:epoxide hydrolase-like predicted phosphatase
MPIRALVFDFGGVLANLGDMPGQRKWEQQLGLSQGELFTLVLDSDISHRAMIGEVDEERVWEHFATHLNLDTNQLEELRRDFWMGERVNQELLQFIAEMAPHYRTAVLSNAWSGARQEFVEVFGLDELFDMIIISAEEGVAKPDPRMYFLTAQRLGIPPGEAIFVDDMLENVKAARAAGMKSVHFKDAAQTIAEIRRILAET